MRRWAAEAMPPGASLLAVTCNTRGSYLLQLLSMLQHPHTRGRVASYPHFLEHVWQPLLTAAGLPTGNNTARGTRLPRGSPKANPVAVPPLPALNFRARTPKIPGRRDLKCVRQ